MQTSERVQRREVGYPAQLRGKGIRRPDEASTQVDAYGSTSARKPTRGTYIRRRAVALAAVAAIAVGAVEASRIISASSKSKSVDNRNGSLTSSSKNDANSDCKTYTIGPEFTVWDAARQIVGPNGDPRPEVDRLIQGLKRQARNNPQGIGKPTQVFSCK